MITNGKIQLYPYLRVAIMLAVGIVIGDGLGSSVDVLRACAVVTCCLLVACFFLWRKPVTHTVVIMCMMVATGTFWMLTYKRSHRAVAEPQQAMLNGVVMSRPQVGDKTVRFDLAVVGGKYAGRKVHMAVQRDGMGDAERLRVGDGLTLRCMLYPPEEFGTRRNFSFVRWMQVHDFVASGYARSDCWDGKRLRLSDCGWSVRARIRALGWRDRWLEVLRGSGMSDKALAVVTAMTLGEKTMLDDKQRDIYSMAGASHLLALSGLHLGAIYVLLTFVLLRRRTFYLGQAVALTAIWLYVMLVGMPTSVVRAAIMLTVYAVVEMLGGERITLNALSVAAIVMMCCNPMCLWDVGFELSFVSVLSIVIFFHPFYNRVSFPYLLKHKVQRWIWASISVSIASQILIAPLTAFYFGRFACYFVLSNLVAIPIAVFIIYVSVLLFAVSWWPAAVHVVAFAVGGAADVMEWFLGLVASLPGASVDGIRLNTLQLVMIYIIIGCCYGICDFLLRLYRSATYYTPKY